MTVLSRGARNRRGGRRPGWLLLTTLLVLAIVASSALVFTNKVELLKLAVILSLWAAVVAAFVSVIYRRQSDVDAARARDLKLVYDLQLDREISARREYELSVESHLRRELASELRAQAADEVAALRAELAALRANLEILFDADLGDRPALEGDRVGAGYGDWTRDTTAMPPAPGRVQSSRITPVTEEDAGGATAESPIIDVPEEPLVSPAAPPHQRFGPPPPRRPHTEEQPYPEPDYRGSHRRSAESGEPRPAPEPRPEPTPVAEGSEWRPVDAQGQWLPPGAPGSNWVPSDNGAAAPPPAPGESPGGRHWTGAPGQPRPEPVMQPPPEPAPPRSRHSVDVPGYGQPAPAMSTPPQPAARHRDEEAETEADEGPSGQHTGGQSVAELLARLQANGTGGGGGRRRRREN
jgi:Domain of unknown function (DUF6779)